MSSNVTLEIKGTKKSVLVFALLAIGVGRLIFFYCPMVALCIGYTLGSIAIFSGSGFLTAGVFGTCKKPKSFPWALEARG